jgi:NnrS protein/uncharacterized protein DUF1858
MSALPALDGKVMIPDLLEAIPQTRPVLDRYGLRGCGGLRGPVESLEFFAKAHDVPLEQLLPELEKASRSQDRMTTDPKSGLADTIYRPFFKAGIGVALTLGATWGAYLLLRIAATGSFRAAGLHEVNAHGHAQIFGWVGLFVMGFAYQAFPRFKHTDLRCPGLALVSFWLMLIGLVTRSLAEPLAAWASWLDYFAIGAGAMEVIAIGLFVGIILATLRGSGKPLAHYDYYIVAALGWFLVQAIYDVVYLAATLWATDAAALRELVATWQGPLREIQIHGFAMLMILGVSQRIFPHFYGLPAPKQRLSRWALAAINVAIVGEILGFILMRILGHAWVALWYASVVLLVASVTVLVLNWRIFGSAEESDRSLKFLRTAYVWLFISLEMLVLVPLYQFVVLPAWAPEGDASRIGFSHAFYGAVRHAITVGFISQMIVGVAAKVVPTLNGVDIRRLSCLWAPFILLNAGCALRVSGQTLTNFTAHAFVIAGVSGCLEVAALALWGVHLLRSMSGRVRLGVVEPASLPADTEAGFTYEPVIAGKAVRAENRVSEVLDRYPELLSIFVDHGFRPLANPLLRRTLAKRVTIAAACRKLDVDLQSFLDVLNSNLSRPGPGRLALPMCTPYSPSEDRHGTSSQAARNVSGLRKALSQDCASLGGHQQGG